ncbi:MAG: class I SAM-dependent methyltransferase [Candidatus Omnitrophica bacterium]|nr:class I SAM-dependent methyltransferase [Candidatus Omnitrophota bacterium]
MTEIITAECIVCAHKKQHSVICDKPVDYEYGVLHNEHMPVQCLDCGLISLHPMPTINELKDYYPLDYCNYDDGNKSFLRRFLENLYADSLVKLVTKLIGKKGTILDVGCSNGELLGILQQRGRWICHGVEFKQEIAEAGRRKGRTIFTGTLEDLKLPAESYDLVILNHMIEHARDPEAFLKEVRRVLRKGGNVFIETPNTQSLDFMLFKEKWGCIHFPRHTFLFNPHNLKTLLTKAQFFPREINYSLHTCGWALGCQNSLVEKFKWKRRYGRIAIYPLFLCMFVPFTFLQVLGKNASVMRMIAEK